MKRLSLIMAYYMNPRMLEIHYGVWAGYPAELRDRIEVVIVDDGSPEGSALDVPRPAGLPDLRIFRVLEDRPWHQDGARNLGVYVANGPWLLMTDMDHLVPAVSLAAIMEHHDRSRYYTFARLNARDLKPTLDQDGYDEDYCGTYGTDGLFLDRLAGHAKRCHLDDVQLVLFSPRIVPDAATRTLRRKEGRPSNEIADIQARKEQSGRADTIVTLDFPWEQVL